MASILVLDDSPMIRDLVKTILESEGYAVFVAGTYDEAMAIQQNEHIDLAVVDLVMPDHDGLDATEGLRKSDPLIPVLMLTAYADCLNSPDAKVDRKLAPNLVLRKPVQFDVLLEKVSELLEKTKAKRAKLNPVD